MTSTKVSNTRPLLTRLVDGTEPSSVTIISDSIEFSALSLTKSIIAAALHQQSTVVAILFDCRAVDFLAAFHIEHRKRIICFSRHQEQHATHFDLNTADCLVNVPTKMKSLYSDHSTPTLFYIDSTVPYIAAHSLRAMCSSLQRVCESKCKVVAVVHRDLVETNTTTALQHIASTTIDVSVCQTDHVAGSAFVVHRKQSGKVSSEEVVFKVTDDDRLHIQHRDTTTASTANDEAVAGVDGDVVAAKALGKQLTFDIGLSDGSTQETTAKANMKLPYTLSDSAKAQQLQGGDTGRIHYQPDDNDDFDDEDPDDDLDI